MKLAAIIGGAWFIGIVVIVVLFHRARANEKDNRPEHETWLDDL